MDNIKEAIRALARSGRETACTVCRVDTVDRKARTVDCTPLDESAPLLGVNLQANQGSTSGVVAFPKAGSYVVVGLVADGAAGVVLLADEVESVEAAFSGGGARLSADRDGVRVQAGDGAGMELTREGITLNGGGCGGTVMIGRLTERLNAIERDINGLKAAFSAWAPVPQDGGSALRAAAGSWAGSPLSLTRREDYENERVKHG